MTIAVALPLVEVRLNPDPAIVDALTLRQATAEDTPSIDALISGHLAEGHLLPRALGEIAVHAHRFIVAVDDEHVVGCVDLAPLSSTVAEIRSLVVSEDTRASGVGRRLIDAVVARASRSGFERICAFTHAPSYFVKHGFSLVPHEWLPEKIQADCGRCSLFRRCKQYAVVLPLARAPRACVPLASLHG